MIDDITGEGIDRCPFCKSTGAYVVDAGHDGCEDYWCVECNGCTALGPKVGYPDSVDFDDDQCLEARKQSIIKWNEGSQI